MGQYLSEKSALDTYNPECMLHERILGRRVESTHHGPDGPNQTNTKNNPCNED